MQALIILPKNDYDINNYIKNFNQKEYNYLLKSLTYEEVKIYLPKFELESKFSLNGFLNYLGMKLAFDNKNADFSNLFEEPKKEEKDCISKIIQKAYIKVDEKGTKATVVTKIRMHQLDGKEMRIIMDINHPFLFLIRNKDFPSEHDILFISKIEEFEKENNRNASKSRNRNKSRNRSRSRSKSRSRSRSRSKVE